MTPRSQERRVSLSFLNPSHGLYLSKQMNKKFTSFLIPKGLTADIGGFLIIWGSLM